MIKLAIPTGAGNWLAIDTLQGILGQSEQVNAALLDAWNLYNRSAGVYVNDARVFLDRDASGAFLFASQLNYSDAQPWQNYLTSISGGGDPGGGDPGGGGGTHYTLSHLYRFVLVGADGKADTGANYDLCSIDNQPACQPIQFATMADAIDYAYEHGETPYRVMSSDETWGLIDGTIQEDQSRILPPSQHTGPGSTDTAISSGLLLLGAGFLALLFGRRRSE